MIPRLLVAGVFLGSGLLKLQDPLAFADGIAAFRILPDILINPLALSVPFFEVATAVALLSRSARSAGALAACGLSLVFFILFATALARGIDVRCACFGKWEILQVSAPAGLVRSLVLLAVSLWVFRRPTSRCSELPQAPG